MEPSKLPGTAASSNLQPAAKSVISNFQVAVLAFAIFLKGGLLGAYVPFVSLWLSEKGYDMRELGIVSLTDALCSFFLPVVGGALDKLRSHNLGFIVLLIVLTVLKLSYIPAADSFAMILVLTAFTAPLLRATNSILDALVLYAFQEKSNFSKVRLFGDLGWGFLALLNGVLYSLVGSVDVFFYVFAGICLSLAVIWCAVYPYMETIRPDSKQMTMAEFSAQLELFRTEVLNARVARALFCVWVFGISIGLINTFEFVLLTRLMGSGVLLGLCKLLGTLASLPVWYFIPNLMESIGIFNLQLVGLAFASFRLFILGVITNPWYALLSELFAGIGGFAVAYGPITIFAGKVTDEDMKGTAQTIIMVILTGLGAGLSALAAGFYAHEFGVQNTFLMGAIVMASVCSVLALYDATAKFVFGTYRSLEESCKILS